MASERMRILIRKFEPGTFGKWMSECLAFLTHTQNSRAPRPDPRSAPDCSHSNFGRITRSAWSSARVPVVRLPPGV